MGQTAEKLLELLEQYGGDEKQILRENRELEYFYALSDMRENLLEWYPFGTEDNLLQIGSGCGAMTGLFGARVKTVTVLDGDETDLAVNRKRHGACDNINYVNCTLKEYAAKAAGEAPVAASKHSSGEAPAAVSEHFSGAASAAAPCSDFQYDCVTLVDGLGEDPEETITLAKMFVKPGGVLLLAADNPLGLKHWAGAPKEPGAMGRERLAALLPGAECYYPLPDYRAASEIYSDRRLPAKGDLTGMVISYDYPEFLRTDVGASWDTICQEGSFREFANSYLMVWRRHG